MTDIKIRWDEEIQTGDFLFSNNDLEMDDGLASAIYISIFTDHRAEIDDPVPNEDDGYFDRRGWWGETISPDVEGDKIGSKLWLLDRSKTEEVTIALTEQYVRDSLEWLIEDEIATDVLVTAREYIEGPDAILTFQITIEREEGEPLHFSFEQSGLPLSPFPESEE